MAEVGIFGGRELFVHSDEVTSVGRQGFRDLATNFKGESIYLGVRILDDSTVYDHMIYEISKWGGIHLYLNEIGSLSTQGAKYLADNFNGYELDLSDTEVTPEGRDYLIRNFRGRILRIADYDVIQEIAERYDESIKGTLQRLNLPADVFEAVVNPMLHDDYDPYDIYDDDD